MDIKSILRCEYLLILLIFIFPETSIEVIFLSIIFVAFLILDKEKLSNKIFLGLY